MKKILAVLLATSSVAVFADSFQDFNNNLYAQYGYTGYSNDAQTNQYGIGGTFQSKNNVWLNANMVHSGNLQGQSVGGAGGVQVGYAFQFFGNDDSGFQVIPYVSAAAINLDGATDNYAWGLGVQPEYRFLSSLKVSLGMGLVGYNGQTGKATPENPNGTTGTAFLFNVNPEVQYDIAKTIMLSVGYNYTANFNSAEALQNGQGVNVKVGYLF
jgi:hypothetical protein